MQTIVQGTFEELPLSKHARLPESSVLGLCLYMRNDLVGAIRLEN